MISRALQIQQHLDLRADTLEELDAWSGFQRTMESMVLDQESERARHALAPLQLRHLDKLVTLRISTMLLFGHGHLCQVHVNDLSHCGEYMRRPWDINALVRQLPPCLRSLTLYAAGSLGRLGGAVDALLRARAKGGFPYLQELALELVDSLTLRELLFVANSPALRAAEKQGFTLTFIPPPPPSPLRYYIKWKRHHFYLWERARAMRSRWPPLKAWTDEAWIERLAPLAATLEDFEGDRFA